MTSADEAAVFGKLTMKASLGRFVRRGTSGKWRRDAQRSAVREALADRRAFVRLESIDMDTKVALYPKARRCINRTHSADRSSSVLQFFLLFALTMGICLGLLTAMGWWIWLLVPDGYHAFAALGAFLFLLYPLLYRGRATMTELLRIVSPYPVALVLFAIAVTALHVHPVVNPWVIGCIAFVGGGAFMGAFEIAMIAGLAPSLMVFAAAQRRQLDSRIFVTTILLLRKIERNPQLWESLPFKTELIKSLDLLATMIEHDLPARFGTSDEAFRAWAGSRAGGIAAYFREMKRWVFLAKRDTREFLQQELAHVVVCMAEGNWDSLRVMNVVPLDTRQRRITSAVSSLRTLAASVLPVGLLLGMARFGVRVPPTISFYVYLGAVVWLAGGLVSLLDPVYSTKLDAAKAMLQFLPLPKGKE